MRVPMPLICTAFTPGQIDAAVASIADDATGEMAHQEFLSGESAALNACGFTRTGYTFTGWNTKDDGSGTSYDDKAEVSDLADPGKTAVLYAQWKKDTGPTPGPDPDPEPEPMPAPTPTDPSKKDASQTKVTETKTSTVTKCNTLPTTGDDSMMCALLTLILALMGLVSIVAAQRMHLG